MATRTRGAAPPTEQLALFERALAPPAPLVRAVLVRGEERYFRDEALRLCAAAAPARELELVRHDALDPDFRLADLLADLSSAPMFASARCIVVRNATPILKKEGSLDTEFTTAALAFVAGGAVPGTLLIEAPGLRADHAVARAIVARGGPSLELRCLYSTPPAWEPDPRKAELVQWLCQRARERRIALTVDDAVYIAEATGNDLHALVGQLERIAARGERGLRSVVSQSSGATPFAVAEWIARGEPRAALAGLEALFRGGFDEKDGSRLVDPKALANILFGSLRSKLRQTVAAARAHGAANTPVTGHPQARAELEARLALRSAREWEAMLEAWLALERSSRLGDSVSWQGRHLPGCLPFVLEMNADVAPVSVAVLPAGREVNVQVYVSGLPLPLVEPLPLRTTVEPTVTV